ncbi:LysR family transcriptional regulator [Novosphingobium sp. Chol11]|uniref:LysR family transcriptional regulator n=1 Tax=Novosphingobium sp. Chol11 TaxID=1385763 RepID=UPI0025FBD35F|nr:LysR family transcriptional regulator [Novosphingobium sp. Chol11]
MEMHQVRYFLAAARLLNFTRAAIECNVSQPSLTKAIQKLEEEFGAPLFRRERARTHLTALGKAMLPHLQRSFDAAQTAKQMARGLGRAEIAPLTLGVARTVEHAALQRVLAELGNGLAGLELALTSGSCAELIELAMGGSLDLVIIELPEEAPDRLDRWPLFEDVYQVVIRPEHGYASTPPESVEALEEEVWIDYAGDGCAGLARIAGQSGVQIEVRHQAHSLAQLRQMVLAGLGCAWLPLGVVGAPLVAVPLPFAQTAVKVVLASVAGRRRGIAAEAFVRAARAQRWDTFASDEADNRR